MSTIKETKIKGLFYQLLNELINCGPAMYKIEFEEEDILDLIYLLVENVKIINKQKDNEDIKSLLFASLIEEDLISPFICGFEISTNQ